MNSGMIAENIFNAIDVIVDKKLREAKYDSTIIAKIIKVQDSALGRYEVQYQDAKFIALSVGGGAYQVNDNVYVLVPTNDLSRDKYILGLSNNNRRITALGDIVTTTQLEAIIKRIEELEGQEIPQLPSLEEYAKKSDLDNYATKNDLNTLELGDKVTVTPQGTGTETIATIKVNENSYVIKAPKVEAGSTVSYQGTNAANGDTIGTLTIDDTAYDIKAPSLNGYAKTSDIPDTSQFVTETDADNKYATKNEISAMGNGDMLKSIYDQNNNNIIDKAEDADALGGVSADKYATQEWVQKQGYNNTTYTLTTKDNDIVLQDAQEDAISTITVPYATKAGSATTANNAETAQSAQSADTAARANALNLSEAVGSTATPVYFNADGQPAAINYTINKSVPEDAVFTDTTYPLATYASSENALIAGVVKSALIEGNHIPTWEGYKKAYIDQGFIYYDDENTTYDVVASSTGAKGLMRGEDKIKLNQLPSRLSMSYNNGILSIIYSE